MSALLASRPDLGAENPACHDSAGWRWAALFVILLGVALRLWQVLTNPSLWVDEAAIARNVLDRHPAQLFGALDYGQVAPPGFLLGVKLSAALFGRSELALRLVPLLAGLAGPFLFYVVARAVLRPLGTTVATLLFSLAVPLIFFSSNLKQYSSDVAVTLLVIGVALGVVRTALTPRSTLGYALLAALFLFGSQAAAFALTAAGAVIFWDAQRERRSDRRLRVALVACWAVLVGAAVIRARSVLTLLDEAYLQRFWASGFMPRQGGVAWGWAMVRNLFGGPPNPGAFDGSLHYAAPVLFAVLVVIGGVGLARGKPVARGLVIGPIALAILASATHTFPFGARVGLFLLPLFLLAAVAGAEQLGDLPRRRAARIAPLLLVPFAIAALVRQPPPWLPQHLRPVMQHLAARFEPGDALWVYYGAGQAYLYYAPSIPLAGTAGDVRVATCDRADPRDLLRQVDALRGRARVWILLAHGSGPFGFDERGMLLDYLETIGRPLDRFHAPAGDTHPNRAEAVLFDLSDPGRLAATTADRFPLGNLPPSRAWTCYGTMSPQGLKEETVAAVLALGDP